MGHIQIAGNLPFPALVLDFVAAAGVSYRAGDTKALLPRDDQYVPNGKYIRPPTATTSQPTEPAEDIPPSTPQAPTTNQLLHQILERLDRQEHKVKLRERRNKRRFTYLNELLMGNYKDPNTSESTSFTSTGSHDGSDCGDAVTSPPFVPD